MALEVLQNSECVIMTGPEQLSFFFQNSPDQRFLTCSQEHQSCKMLNKQLGYIIK